MDNNLDKTLLYETYKPMLTANMQNIFEQYYFSDLSLREIGENNKISFQAVRDTLKKVDKQLSELENKLKLFEIKKKILYINEMISKPDIKIEKISKEIRELGEL